MKGAVARWGNSLALRLPKGLTESADLNEGDDVDLRVEDGRIIVTKARPRYTLEALMADYRPEHRHGETDWGAPVGKEVP